MARDIKITRITTTHFNYEIADMELEEQLGFDTVYRKGGRHSMGGGILTIETSTGVSGTANGGIDARTAKYLLGRNPLELGVSTRHTGIRSSGMSAVSMS